MHPDDRPRPEALLQGALAGGGRYRCEHRVVRPDGTVRHLLAPGEVSLDAGGQACRLLGTVQDTGVAREAIAGQPPGDFQRLVRSEEHDRALAMCVQQGLCQTVTRHSRLPGKPDRWMETTLYPCRQPEGIGGAAVLVTREVTARLANQRALVASADNLRLTLNTTQDGIFASDARGSDKPLLFANQRLLEIWRIPPEQAPGLTPRGVHTAAMRFFTDPARELPRIVEMSPAEGLFTESLMAAAASNTPEAQDRLRAFLEGRAGKVVKQS